MVFGDKQLNGADEIGVSGVLSSGYVNDQGTVEFDAVQPGQTYVASISGELVLPVASGGGSYPETFTANADGSLEALRTSIPAARSLPLLSRLARAEAGPASIEYLDGSRTLVEVEPCA